MSEDDVNIKKHKQTLEDIRRERDAREQYRPEGRYSSDRKEGDNRDTPRVEANPGRVPGAHEGTRQDDNASQRDGERIRPIDRPGVNASQSTRNNSRQTDSASNVSSTIGNVTPLRGTPPAFKLKNPFKQQASGPVKLFTKGEAELEHDKLSDVYFHGSALIDDVLEIIVKDHEPVQIWQLERDEADTLAELHLERAQKSQEAARSARKLIEIYDRLYLYLLVYPRVKLTAAHIKEHKGFSFK